MTNIVRIGNYLCINRYDDVKFEDINLGADDPYGSGTAICSMYIKDESTGEETTIEFPYDFNMIVTWCYEYGDKNDDLVVDEITIRELYVDWYDNSVKDILYRHSRELGLYKTELERLFQAALNKLESSYRYSINRNIYMVF